MQSAVIYCRVSTKDQAEGGLSLDQQEKVCRDKCAAEGWRVRGVYVEKGISGRTKKKRVQLQKALERVEQTKGTLVFYALSRLARSTIDAHLIAEQVRACGGAIASVSEGINTNNAMGRAFFGILAVLAQMESELIGERVKASNDYTVATKGHRTQGRQPAGWKFDPETGDRVECPDEQQILATVRKAFAENRRSYNRTAKALQEMGTKTISAHRHGHKTEWHRETVKRLLAASKARTP